MIFPYYNCLLINHKYNQILLQQQGEQLIKDYLQQYLSTPHPSTKIFITCLGLKNELIINRMNNIINMLITNLSLAVYEINNTYTLEQSKHSQYQALRQLTVKEGEGNKKPAVIENLNLLKQYYVKHYSENQMKQFLKTLLIKEINHEKRCIVYRSRQQIVTVINKKIGQIKGNIQISQSYELVDEQSNNIYIIMANQKTNNLSNLYPIIPIIQNNFSINKNINFKLTQNYTIKYLRQKSSDRFRQFSNTFHYIKIYENKNEIKRLKQVMILIANLRTITIEGLRLSTEQTKLRQEFLIFAAEMNVKYTKELSQYILAFKQMHQYAKIKEIYLNRKKYIEKMGKYIKGFLQRSYFKKDQMFKKNRECGIIQGAIKGFLIKRRIQTELMNQYLLQKRAVNNKNYEDYCTILRAQNEEQIKKFSLFNRYKYGFCSCIYIIDITNKANCTNISPKNLSNILGKTNKYRQLITKIQFSQQLIQVHTIQGKLFQLSCSIAPKKNENYESNKQNVVSNGSSYQSIIHQFQSESKGIILKSSISSKNSQSRKQMQKSSKQRYIKIYGLNYEFKLEENGKLYGKGSNKYGQLGIPDKQFIQQYTLIKFSDKVKLVATGNHHTIIITSTNKLFHFGKQNGKLLSSKIPIQLHLSQRFIIQQIVISLSNVYFLTDNNKIYSLQSERTVRVPKQIQLGLDHFSLIKSGNENVEMIYLLGFWTNSLDVRKKIEIEKYLLQGSPQDDKVTQSILVEDQKIEMKEFHQLSAILQEHSF